MEVKEVNELNMNNEGLIYLNSNLKINAIRLSLIFRLNSAIEKLLKSGK